MAALPRTPTRHTIIRPTTLQGVGIHTGQPCWVRFEPAGPGEGIVLVRESTGGRCPATIDFADAAASDRRTVLVSPSGERFEQVEHILAATAAAGISDLLVLLKGPEPPFMGGGSEEFLEALIDAGRSDLSTLWDPLEIEEPVVFRDGNAILTASPAEGCELSAFVDFPGTVVGSQGATIQLESGRFLEEVAPARTFALARDVEMLRKAGLGKGGTLENTVIFDDQRYHNESLRFPDEPARHKLIDLLGDLALLGVPLRGHFSAWRAGHRSHVRFAQFLAQECRVGR